MKQPPKTSAVTQRTLDSRSAYDQWAQSYDAHPNPTVAMARIALERDIGNVEGLSVFEFGCGTGENLYNLGSKGAYPLWGVDVSDGMLSRAREKLDEFAPHLFQIEEGEYPSVTTRKFDLILAILVLEHVKDIDIFFQFASGQVAQGGRVYVSELHPRQSARGVKAHFQDDSGVEISTRSFHRSESEFVESAERCGLMVEMIRSWAPDDESVEREPKTLKYKGQPLLLTMSLVNQQSG